MATWIALIRGINVGRAKRVAMADLRELCLELGHSRVRTLLNSGNLVFDSARRNPALLAQEIQSGIATRCGVQARTIVMGAGALEQIIRDDPLQTRADDPSRYLVAFPTALADLAALRPLARSGGEGGQLVVGSRAVYLWCAGGILESRMLPAFTRLAGDSITTRNWATVLKLQAMAKARG